MIDFTNARILGYNQKHDFLGDIFNFSTKKELSIEGSIYKNNNTNGVAAVWGELSNIEQGAKDYDSIIINGIDFGRGRVNSINFKEGNDVQKKDYTASITVYSTGNLSNMTGSYYSGINFSYIHIVESFAETFDFTIKDDGSYAYRQTVSVKFLDGKAAGIATSAIQLAKNLASSLFSSTPAFGFIDAAHAGFYNNPGKRTYTESYNVITNECNFSENYETDNSLNGYSLKFTHQLNTDENGSTNVSETGLIRGLVPDYYVSAEAGYATESSSIYSRCAEVANHYLPSGFNPLASQKISSEKRINKIQGEINYTVTFTNNPSFNPLYIWDYTQEIARNTNDCYYKIRERGKIKGFDGCSNTGQKYTNAQNAFATVKTGIAGRSTTFYNTAAGLSNQLKAVSSSQRVSPLAGEISYDYTYTDDLNYTVSSTIKKIDYQIEDSRPVDKVNTFNIIGVKELVQKLNYLTEGNWSVKVKVQGRRNANYAELLSAAKGIAGANKPTSTNFLETCSYSYSPNEHSLDLNAGWKYFS